MRLLSGPALGCATGGKPCCFGHGTVVLSLTLLHPRQGSNNINLGFLNESIVIFFKGQANRVDMRAAFAVQNDDDETALRKTPAHRLRFAIGWSNNITVEDQPSGLHFGHLARLPWCQTDKIAVLLGDCLGYARLQAKPGLLPHVPDLAVHGDQNLRS